MENNDRKYYDEAFMEVFTNRKIIQSLLEDFVHEDWVDLIDFSSMEITKSVFKGIDDSKRESDLLLKFNLKSSNPENIFVFILLEFQSTAKPIIFKNSGISYTNLQKAEWGSKKAVSGCSGSHL